MLKQLRKVLELLPGSDKIKLLGLLCMMFIGALLEVVGISTLPAFVSIVATPDRVLDIEFLEPLWSMYGITNGGDLLVFGAIVLIVVFILKNAYIIFFRYIEARFVFNRYVTISHALYSHYMTAPYVFSLSRNTAELLRNITQDAHFVVNNVLDPSLKVLKDVIMLVGIFILLLLVEPWISLLVMLLLGGAGAFFLKSLKNRMRRHGKQAISDRKMMIQIVNEGLGGLKEITVLNREYWSIARFKKRLRSYANSQLFKNVTTGSTKPVIETMAVGGMLLIALLLYMQGRGLEVIIPILTLFGAATIRIMPALQGVISNYNTMRYFIHSVAPVHQDLIGSVDSKVTQKKPDKLLFSNCIQFQSCSFRYPNTSAAAVSSIKLTIKKGEAVAFVGPSGAGKTTIVDMLLGLLEPNEGEIFVDGISIFQNTRGWQQNIGYIPQYIFLSDDTIRRNIAFGLPDNEIDDNKIQKTVVDAQLSDLIKDLDDGLDTIIGERGIRLSGGQRQRIGIARALYHNPSVLIMDEATSALDNITEKYVIEAIERFKGERTIIMIAHRLTTVQNCDILYFMKNGQIMDQGSFDELIRNNAEFQQIALLD